MDAVLCSLLHEPLVNVLLYRLSMMRTINLYGQP
jgi:hypothetical protein